MQIKVLSFGGESPYENDRFFKLYVQPYTNSHTEALVGRILHGRTIPIRGFVGLRTPDQVEGKRLRRGEVLSGRVLFVIMACGVSRG
jgi:hypothetical protein